MDNDNTLRPRMGDGESMGQNVYRDFAAPLAGTTQGRLLFASGASGITLNADPTIPELYRARFEQHIPSVQVQGHTVRLEYRHHGFLNWLAYRRAPRTTLLLNGAIPWEIEFRGGVSDLTADLRNLQLRALDLCSVSAAVLMLPHPVGVAFIHLSGSASELAIERPMGVAVRLHIGGSASQLQLDSQQIGAIADGIRWQSPEPSDTVDRYEITISGSVSHLTIAAR